MTALQRLFDPRFAFDSPLTVAVVVGVVVMITAALLICPLLRKMGRMKEETYHEVMLRTRSWVVLALLIGGPILLGAAWTIAGVALLSLFCYREFARATGLFRHRLVHATVVILIFLLTFAVLDHWQGFFAALIPLGVTVIAAVAILEDQPAGYIQRVALGVFGFLLFGVSLAHLGYIANDADYRPILLTLIAAVELNDVFAFISGKTFGKRKLCPNTSPGKTRAGALGAVILTTAFIGITGHFFLTGGFAAHAPALLGLGLIISVSGQLGDLMLSSIKRDLGIKDIGKTIPGHGGLLDRFDSLLLAAPAAFHYIHYLRGIGYNQSPHVITGLLTSGGS